MKYFKVYPPSRSPFLLDGVTTVAFRIELRLFKHVDDWDGITQELLGVTEAEVDDSVAEASVDFHVSRTLSTREMCDVFIRVSELEDRSCFNLQRWYFDYLQESINPRGASLQFSWR